MQVSGIAILLFVICALLLGALLKTVLRNSKLLKPRCLICAKKIITKGLVTNRSVTVRV